MFDKKKIKDVAQLAMIAVDDNDLSYFSSEILEFLKSSINFNWLFFRKAFRRIKIS